MNNNEKENGIKSLSGNKDWKEIKEELGFGGDFYDYCHNCYRPVEECICSEEDRKIYDYPNKVNLSEEQECLGHQR